jgi:hypothetical protein
MRDIRGKMSKAAIEVGGEGGMMADENADTADLTMNEKLDRILCLLGEVNDRLSALESAVDGRTSETQKKLDKIIQEIFDNERLSKIRLPGLQQGAAEEPRDISE